MSAPPRPLVLLAAWANLLAGISLTISFLVIFLSLTCNAFSISPGYAQNVIAFKVMQVTMVTEGALYALAGFVLTKINVMNNDAAGAVSQIIIFFGGCFFTVSGWGVPAKIISLKYVIPLDTNALFADACAYYGITCFMVGTSIGLRSVWSLPKNKIISPFWGVVFFFLGAWTIGIFGLWIPCIAGGMAAYEDVGGSYLGLPTFSWKWPHVFTVIGAVFLTTGALIFGLLDSFLGKSRSREPPLMACDAC
eukprot:gnl/TRDRNA2_/TRDRNA2_29461_c0_seq1.p1 gnl/TRDRNA2_/TRDRNA2_29461_c0~~gnl/TRDRNA2_/TRDRNA2_29461_c0_seq1.p1  ORF type:complete len:250 (-),score=33.39 gnl/TRDRNA2_/TRDRNA2_29461_c0_seq1:44-793(-)